MEQFEIEQAHTLSLEEIRAVAEEEITKGCNPCLKKLVFIETRAKGDQPRKIFPAYPYSVLPGKDGDVLILFVVQYIMKSYNTACISISMNDIGVNCRFWNLPPTEKVMDAVPLADAAGVQ